MTPRVDQPAWRGGESLIVRGRQFRWGERTLVMGILNVTPDSFSGDGLRAASADVVAAALEQAQGFLDAGADILDVGGESTRPGAAEVDAAEERARVVPVITALRQHFDAPISIDSPKADVVAAALAAGADIINDIRGLRLPGGGWNDDLARLAADRAAPLILMHNRRAVAVPGPIGHYQQVEYRDLLREIVDDLRESIGRALDHGVRPDHIIVDPGVGFGKTPAQNIELLRRLGELRALGYPILLGTSRKSFIGLALGGLPPEERVEGTAATVALGIASGADIVRVHDVAAMTRVVRVADAIVRPGAWERLTGAR